jgi:hypothetical protein
MNDNKNRRGARQRAAALAVTAGIVLLTAACGSSPASSSADSPVEGGSSNSIAKLDAYAHCLTSHGVTGVTVGSGGTLNINNGGLQMTLDGVGGIPSQVESHMSPAMQSAFNACKSLAPSGGQRQQPGQAEQTQNLQRALKYAQCLRKHGVPNMPDPSGNGTFNVGGTGINPQSPQFLKAQQDCQSQEPSQLSINDSTKVAS